MIIPNTSNNFLAKWKKAINSDQVIELKNPNSIFNAAIDGKSIIVNGDRVRMVYDRDPLNLPWSDLEIDVVLECTGSFRSYESASKHIQAGAKKVIISSPASEMDATIVYGVNDNILQKDHTIISNASCTTNCLAPIIKPLLEILALKHGLLTTTLSYTKD